jgi:YesN/AraC family two-component response regulator
MAQEPETQTIFMSGYPDEIITRHGILEKETNFINKPFTKDELLSKVQEVIEKLEK